MEAGPLSASDEALNIQNVTSDGVMQTQTGTTSVYSKYLTHTQLTTEPCGVVLGLF